MLPQLFLKTKLLPPRLGRQILPRPRLVGQMASYLDGPATIVCANAGCGKTTIVADFVHSCRFPYVWYQIDVSDQDLGVFFGYLVYGLRRQHPDFGQAVLSLIRETEDLTSKAEQLADVFVNEVVEQIEEKIILVMDDFHHVDKSLPIGAAVDRLLQYLPDVLHIILMSRSMPNLSVSRLKSKGLVGIIDREALLFVPDEVRRLFDETFHRPLPPDLIDRFYEKTEGWITALQLIQQALQRLPPDDQKLFGKAQAMAVLQQSEVDIFDYFAEEVFQAETPEMCLTLGRLSLFERISPEAFEYIFGGEEHRENLRSLARRNVFVERSYESGTEEEYRLHPLFRSFLKRWLADKLGAQEERKLHNTCADYFAGASQWDLALHHYSEASASDAIADLLAQRGRELIELGRFEVIKGAFERVPDDSFVGRERALIARADVAMTEGDYAQALALYERADRLAEGSGNVQVRAESLRGQAYIARYAGEFEQAISLASSAIGLAPELHFLRARCFNIMGLCRLTSSQDTNGAIECWRSALAEARRAGDDRFARIVLHNLGLPYSMEGDLNEAIHWISQMIETRKGDETGESAAQTHAPFPQEAIAHLNLARLKMQQGRLDESEPHLELALERCRMFNLSTLKVETLEGFGNLYRERGDYSRSLNFYGEAERAYRQAGLSLTDRELLDERAILYMQMGKLPAAERDASTYYEARHGGSPPERVTALITRGRIEMAGGRTILAEASLVEAAQLAQSSNLRYFEARAATSLARLYWDSARSEMAFAQLSRAVELSLRYDYSYWLSREAAQSPALFRAAVESGVSSEYLRGLIVEKGAGAAVGAAATSIRVAQSSAEQFAILVEQPNCDLSIRMLGPTEVNRNPSEPMPEDTWRLSKSLHILCYIASRRNHRAPKDALVEVFWPEADPETIAKNFHPMISHLRKALNRDQVIKKDFILYRESAYLLNSQYRYQVDVEEFERLLANAREAKRSGDPDSAVSMLEQAIALYRGDFLEELYYEWIEELKVYYRDLYLEALKELAEYYRQSNKFEDVIRYGLMILQRDPYREAVLCHVMEAYVRIGNRVAAIEQFDRLRKMLRSELGVAPLPATVAIYEALIK